MPPQLLPAAGPDFSSTPPPAPRRSDIALPRDTPRPTRAAPAKPVVPAGDPTVEDLIRQEADKAGVPHELALAVAEQESGFDPTRTNPVAVNGEHATGTFQLLPSTAKRLGVDPHNPVENIHGGVAYLRELLDEHQGDLPKVLSAYGGVKTNQTYVPEVLARLPKFAAASTTGAAPAASAGTPPPAPPETWGQWGVRHGKQVLSAFDPRTAEGRQNLAGATGAGLATGAMVATAPASVPIVGLTAATAGILGAAGGGMAEEAGEQLVGTAPPSGSATLGAGARQGTYEAVGQAGMGVLRGAGSRLLASRVGRYASEGLSASKQATLTRLSSALDAAQSLLRTTRTTATEGTRLTAASTRAALSRTAAGVHATVEGARTAGAQQVEGTKTFAAEDLANATRLGGEHVSHAQARAAQDLTTAQGQAAAGEAATRAPYEQLVGAPPPDAAAAGRAANAVIQEGGAKLEKDRLGEAVGAAAQKGPRIPKAPLEAELDRLSQQITPMASHEPTTVTIGGKSFTAEQAAQMLPGEDLSGFLIPPDHPLPAALSRVRAALANEPSDTIAFADAHKIKRLVDDAVSWDSPARTQAEQVSKGFRQKIRGLMRGHAPYDQATADYGKIATLYEEGHAPKLRKLAEGNPEAIVGLLTPTKGNDKSTAARMLTELLTTRAEAGGGGAEGRAALEAVQSSWVRERLINGGLEKLGDRLDAIPPAFRDAFLGDAQSQAVLDHLKLISTAYKTAVLTGEQGVEAATTAGKGGVEAATSLAAQRTGAVKEAGRAATDVASEAATLGTETAQREGRQAMATARTAGASLVAHRRQEGARWVESAAQAVDPAQEALRVGREAATTARQELKESTLGPYTGKGALRQAGGDALRVLAYGPHRVYGAVALSRLLVGPTADDLVHWAALSPQGTQLLVGALTSPVPAEALANLVRTRYGGAEPPMAVSHAVGQPPPAATPATR